MRGLYDDLMLSLRPLALLPFRLDLLHEYKALHASLLKMEERLALHTSQSPTTADPQLDLLLAAKESKEFRNAAARTTDRNCRSPRPRSCYENASGGLEDVQGVLRKRWSGVQLGSRLVTAIDKLLTEEGTAGASSSSGDYTDSLDPPKKGTVATHHRHEDTSDEATTDLRVSDLSSRDGDVSERSATDKDTDTEKGLRLEGRGGGENESEGEKFRRLQLKWEAMTGQNPPPPVSKIAAAAIVSPEGDGEDRDKERTETLTSPAGVQRSRIPRPVSITSPQQAFKPFESSREKTSPQIKQGKRPASSSSKDHPKPTPRRSLKDRVLSTDHYYHYDQSNGAVPRGQTSSSGASVRSRVGSRTQASPAGTNAALTSGSGLGRASSVPGRKLERGSSGTRYENHARGSGTPRSASQGRRRGHAEETR